MITKKYGTKKQKETYLPKLSTGEYIPCFGLTGPNNGSDATGSIDNGILKKENNKYFIDITLNKRYITLAPIANLVGIAFNLTDPHNYLNKEGYALLLLKRSSGLEQNTYHNPLDIGVSKWNVKRSSKN